MKILTHISAFVLFFLLVSCDKNNGSPTNLTDANFSISGFEAAAPSPITFINTSRNATTYLWNFGDGATSIQANPTHTYTFDGTYQLTLRATGSTGVDSICKLVAIAAPMASNKSNFSYFFDRCNGTPVGAAFKTVNPLSSNTVWDFGNGVINVTRDPIVQFLFAGDYTIKYSSELNGVRDTIVRIIQIL